jgi:putative chitinase
MKQQIILHKSIPVNPKKQNHFLIQNYIIMTSQSVVYAILLGGILGLIGQSIRVFVGIKKMYDTETETKKISQLMESQRLFISLLIGFIAGVLASFALNIAGMTQGISNEVIMGIIGAGYAGTDFIEGFIRKSIPKV